MKHIAKTILISTLTMTSPHSHADIYQVVDTHAGKVTFTNFPPKNLPTGVTQTLILKRDKFTHKISMVAKTTKLPVREKVFSIKDAGISLYKCTKPDYSYRFGSENYSFEQFSDEEGKKALARFQQYGHKCSEITYAEWPKAPPGGYPYVPPLHYALRRDYQDRQAIRSINRSLYKSFFYRAFPRLEPPPYPY